MGGGMTSALISANELHDILHLPEVKILDASYNLAPSDVCISGAIDFDIDAVADKSANLPHILPPAKVFEQSVGRLGIGNNDRVIVYDRSGMAMAAARVWWMFRVFGHDKVQVLNGGLPAWQRAGFPVERKTGKLPAPAQFKAAFRPELFKEEKDMLENVTAGKWTVLDARDGKRYSGEAQEPRPGMDSGHIPGSFSVPYASLVDAQGEMKPPEALKDMLGSVDTSNPVVCTCGSGVTACMVALALHETGRKDAAIYGGSWAEWGANPALPKKKGSAP